MSTQYKNINPAKAYEKWGSTIGQMVKVDEGKLRTISTLLQIQENSEFGGDNVNQTFLESYGSIAPADMIGIGASSLPADGGSGVGAQQSAFFQNGYKRGSGDIPAAKMSMSIHVAAHTIAMELLPSIPMELPTQMFAYMEEKYSGQRLDDADNDPVYFSLTGGSLLSGNFKGLSPDDTYIFYLLDASGTGTGNANQQAFAARFVGNKRISGAPILKFVSLGEVGVVTNGNALTYTAGTGAHQVSDVITAVTASLSLQAAPVGTAVDAGLEVQASSATPSVAGEEISAADDHIAGFTHNGSPASSKETATQTYRMTREEGERGTTNAIELDMYSTLVEAGTIEITGRITRTKATDMRAYGVDPLAKLLKACQNELIQTMNKDILETMFKLGVSTAADLRISQGLNLNLFINNAVGGTKALTNFSFPVFEDILGNDRAAEFGNIPNAENNSGAENLSTRQRRIASRIFNAAGAVGQYSRNGQGDFAVMSLQNANALKDYIIGGNIESSPSGTRNLYYYATISGGIKIYIDPNMGWNDNRILVGRKGTEEDSGLKLFIYRLADTVTTISETSFSEKMVVTSRYSLLAAGHHPSLNYITFMVDSEVGFM